MPDLDKLFQAINRGKNKEAVALTKEAIEGNVPPQQILNQMIAAMDDVGQRFQRNEAFVPEMLIAARAMKESMALLEPLLVAAGIKPIAKAIIGTVQGDLHDIGKNLVAMMWKGANFGVVDLGTNVSPEKFVAAGFGTERIPFMYNDFVIVGPASDPAGIRGMKSATAALKQISEKLSTFVTRGDKSGTHVAESELWTKAGVKPAGAWYKVYEKGSEGNVPTLRFTSSAGSYTLIDRATYLSIQKEIKLEILVEGDEELLNRISLIPVNQNKFPHVNQEDVTLFVRWLVSPTKGQKIVAEFGKERFGAALFFPDSKEWHLNQKP